MLVIIATFCSGGEEHQAARNPLPFRPPLPPRRSPSPSTLRPARGPLANRTLPAGGGFRALAAALPSLAAKAPRWLAAMSASERRNWQCGTDLCRTRGWRDGMKWDEYVGVVLAALLPYRPGTHFGEVLDQGAGQGGGLDEREWGEVLLRAARPRRKLSPAKWRPVSSNAP